MSPGWASAWWRHWAGDARAWVVAVRSDGSLVGLAPLVLRRRGPFRTLSALGRDPSNYWDIVAVPGRREAVAAHVAAEIAGRSSEWDAVILGGLPEDAPIASALAAEGLAAHARAPVPFPGIELPPAFEDYLGGLTSKRRKDLRRHLRRLDDGSLTCTEVREPADLKAAVGCWHDLRIRWWEAREKRINAEHGSERFRDFILDLMTALVPQGLGQVWRFEHEGTVVGIEISLVDERCFYAWLDGYDPDFAHLGLGKTAVGLGIRSSIAAGRSYFDFMVGAEEYKYWFGATDRHCRWLMFTHAGARSRMAVAVSRIAERVSRRR